jgi:hypothetical protein
MQCSHEILLRKIRSASARTIHQSTSCGTTRGQNEKDEESSSRKKSQSGRNQANSESSRLKYRKINQAASSVHQVQGNLICPKKKQRLHPSILEAITWLCLLAAAIIMARLGKKEQKQEDGPSRRTRLA